VVTHATRLRDALEPLQARSFDVVVLAETTRGSDPPLPQ
jgi:hypothetical protein